MEHTVNHPGNFAFAKELRSVLEEYNNPPRYLIGEVFGDSKVLKQYIGEQQDGLHTVFLFEMLAFKFNAEYFHELIAKLEGEFPYPFTPTWVFSNHDRKRSISRMGNNVHKAKLLAMLQLTVRGVTFTYMGEEIGFGNEDKTYQFNLNKASLEQYRIEFPVLKDADSFTINKPVY